ncbi:hypothetical protein ABBQ38_003372 [Trebouxia sp. C0009 RCD-2024]
MNGAGGSKAGVKGVGVWGPAGTGVGADAARLEYVESGAKAEVALDAMGGGEAPPRAWGVGEGARDAATGGRGEVSGGGGDGSSALGGD